MNCKCNNSVEQRLSSIEKILFGPVNLPFKALHKDAQLPEKAGQLEACYDMFCVEDDEFEHWPNGQIVYKLEPGASHAFSLGISTAIPYGYALYLWDRSGLAAKYNLHRLAGVIDSTYRGQILACLYNMGKETYYVYAGAKIIQAQLTWVFPAQPVWVDELPESYRGEAGFGSTGE